MTESQTLRNNKLRLCDWRPASQTMLVPAMVAVLLMAAALTGCSAASRKEPAALLIHTQAVGQDNGSLTGNFVAPPRWGRQHGALYTVNARHPGITR